MYEELALIGVTGVHHFLMVADQFLSSQPEENHELTELASAWSVSGLGRPTIHFTLSPREVLQNLTLLTALASRFDLCPRLSIDSFDDRTLDLLDLDFNSEIALHAFEALASLRSRVRVNHLLVRPGATISTIKWELSCFAKLASSVSYLTSIDRLMLAHDLFSGRLDVLPGSPLATNKLVTQQYRETLPSCLPKLLFKAEAVLQECIPRSLSGSTESLGDPLERVLDAVSSELP